MNVSSGTVALAIFLAVTVSVTWLWRRDRKLKQFSGPTLARFTELWHAYSHLKGKRVPAYAQVNEKYGELARIGPTTLLTSSPEVLRRINGARVGYTRAAWFYLAMRLEPGKDNVMSQVDEKLHGQRRAQVSSGYAQRHNPHVESIVDRHIGNFVHLLRSYSRARVDFALKAMYLFLDTTTDLGFGESFGFLPADDDVHGHVADVMQSVPLAELGVGLKLFPLVYIPWIHRLIQPSESNQSGLGKVLRTIRELVHRRFAEKSQTEDLDEDKKGSILQSWVDIGLSEEDCVSEGAFLLIAGSEANAVTLRSTMLHLLSNPPAYMALQREVDEFDSRRNPNAALNPIKAVDVQQLPYLEAVLKEGIRVFPPAVDHAVKVVPPNGDTFQVSGKTVHLPGGTAVVNNPWSLTHRKDVWGEDADVFRPERWLEADEATLKTMDQTVNLVFGYGRWQCLGMNLAKMQLHKTLFEIIKHFDFAIANPANPWKSNAYIGLWVQSDFYVSVTER